MGDTSGSDHRRAEGEEARKQGRGHTAAKATGERDTWGEARETPRLAAMPSDSNPAGGDGSCEGGDSARSSSAGGYLSNSEGADSDPELEGKEGSRAEAAGYRVQDFAEQDRARQVGAKTRWEERAVG